MHARRWRISGKSHGATSPAPGPGIFSSQASAACLLGLALGHRKCTTTLWCAGSWRPLSAQAMRSAWVLTQSCHNLLPGLLSFQASKKKSFKDLPNLANLAVRSPA